MGKGRRFETLDGLRGLCAILVCVYHSGLALGRGQHPDHGFLNVDLFFVLSGFVIALTYEPRLREEMPLSGFLKARGRRLLPTQILGTLICGLAAVPLYWHSAPGWLMAATIGLTLILIPAQLVGLPSLNSDPDANFTLDPPLWSLQGEWIVNGLYGGILYPLSAKMLGLITAITAGYLAYKAAGGGGEIAGKIGLYRTIIGFCLGILIFRAYQANRLSKLSINPLAIYATWAGLNFLPFATSHPFMDVIPGVLIASFLIVLLIQNERPMGRFWAYLGALSYPLYVSHFAIVNLAKWLLPGNGLHPILLAAPILLGQFALAGCLEWVVRLPKSPKPGALTESQTASA